jgi:hypothetical protein
MAVKFLAGINLGKNELQNARIQNLATDSAPSSPAVGQIYFDTDEDTLKIYNGASQWEAVGTPPVATSSVSGTIIVGSTLAISAGVLNVLDGGIRNAQVNSAAGIAISKLADIGATTIMGNKEGAAGAPTALSAANVRGILNVADGATANTGTVTSVGGGTGLTGTVTSTGDLSVDYAGTDNIIRAAGDGTSDTIADNDLILFSNSADDVKRATISQLPFSNNSGTVTSVGGGAGLTGSITTTGDLAVGAGTGITVNADDVAVSAAQTGITSIVNSSLTLGHSNDGAKIHFNTDNQIRFLIDGTAQFKIEDGAIVPITTNDIDLGTTTKEFKNAYFDGTVTSDAFAGNLTGNVTGDLTGTADKVDVANNGLGDNAAYNLVLHAGSNIVGEDGNSADKLRYNPESQTLFVKNITVAGTQTTNQVEIIETSNGIVFEGATANDNETTLVATDPTADRTITLPDAGGTVALTSQLAGNATASAVGLARVAAGDGIDVAVASGVFTVTAETASASNPGVVELATDAETTTGTDTARATTPANVKAAIDDRSFVTTLSGTGAKTNFAVTHNLGTRDCIVQVIDYGDAGTGATYETVYADVTRSGTNTVDIDFAVAPSATEDYRVLIYKVV